MLNPKSYDGARVLEASGRPMLVIGRSYGFLDSIQDVTITGVGKMTKLAEEIMEYEGETSKEEEEATTGLETGKGDETAITGATGEAEKGTKLLTAGMKLIA